MKKTLAMLVVTCLIFLNGSFLSKVNAASNPSLDEVYKAYTKVLAGNGGDTFDLVDINKDGIPELIVDSLQVYTYTNNNLELLYDTMVLETFYYSEESNYLLSYYDWKEESYWYVYEIDSSKKSDFDNSLHYVTSFSRKDTKYSYQAVFGKPGVDTTLEEVTNKINELLPNKIEIKKSYVNNAENRAKYLSVQPQIVAEPTASKVLVDGKEISFQAYAIDGNNYFKLRDIASVLNHSPKQFEVSWDDKLQTIALTTGKSYTSTGEELVASQETGKQEAKSTKSGIYFNNKEIKLVAYNINGNNYFKLRDLGKAIDFGVNWDGVHNAIQIQTSETYKEE